VFCDQPDTRSFALPGPGGPGRSLYEYLLRRGIQVFGISWRNPTRAQRDWDFDTYVQATG
jgi:poly(3-hydroxyalkanoate) synthetase